MKRVFTADNIAHAGLIRSFLEQHGVPSTLRNEHTSAMVGELPFVNNQPELWVADHLHAQASLLLDDLTQESSDTEPWLCSSCQEDNPGNFELCWQCSNKK